MISLLLSVTAFQNFWGTSELFPELSKFQHRITLRTNDCTRFIKVKILKHASSYMFRTSLVHHQGDHIFFLQNSCLIFSAPFVSAQIYRSSLLYHSRLTGHRNALVATLSTPPNVARRLKRRWPSDLHTVTGDLLEPTAPWGPSESRRWMTTPSRCPLPHICLLLHWE